MKASDADQLRMTLADIILNAVINPDLPSQEFVSRDVLDRARLMIDHADVAAAAERARQRPTFGPRKSGGCRCAVLTCS